MAAQKNQKIELDITADVVKFQSGINAAIDRLSTLETTTKAKTSSMVSSFSTLGKTVVGFLAAREMASYVNSIRTIADQYTNINSRLKLVTESSEDFKKVQSELYKTSQDTGSEYASNADAYAKLAVSLKGVGARSEEVLKINELVNKSLVVNGSSTEEASSFMLQFAQAMGSGVLQGDEFRAMMESNGYFAQTLAKAMNTDIAGLRAMSKEGKLTTDVLRKAFPQMAEEINAAFGKIPPTVARAMTALQNAYYRIIDDSNQAAAGTGRVSQAILDLAQTMDDNREGITRFFSFFISGSSKALAYLGGIPTVLAATKAMMQGEMSLDKYFSFKTIKEANAWLIANNKEIETFIELHKESASSAGIAYAGITTAAKGSSAAQVQVQGEALDSMKAKYQQYASEIKRLQDEIAGRENSLYVQLRDLARTGMSGIDAWTDLKSQAEEYATVAQAAFDSGDFATAIQYADQAKDMYAQLNTEVKDGDNVLVQQSEALKTSMDGVKKAGELGIEALKGQQKAAHDAMNVLTEESGFQDLSKGMDDVEGKWLLNWQRMQAAAIKDIDDVEDRLKRIKDKEVTIWINERSKSADVKKFASGGYHSGGFRVVGERGPELEYTGASRIFNNSSTSAIVNAIKSIANISGSQGQVAGSAGSPVSITLNYNGNGSQQDAKRMVDMLMNEMQRRNRRSSR